MEAKLKPSYRRADRWDTRRQQLENDSDSPRLALLVRTLLCGLLLAVFCPWLFKWRNKRRKSLEEQRQHTVPQDEAPAVDSAGRPTNDMSYQIDGPKGQISSLVFLADGKHVICACKNEKTIQMLNIEDRGGREPVMNHAVAVNVTASASSRDGELIVTGDVDGKVVVWDTSFQKRCEAAERHGERITALDVSSSLIASGSNDGTVIVWQTPGEPGSPLVQGLSMDHAHGPTIVSSVKFSPSDGHIASAGGCTVKIWHSRTGHQIASIPIPNSLPAYSLAWSSDGRRLFAGGYGGSIRCFDTVTGKSFSKVVESRLGDDSITSLYVPSSDQFLISFSAPARTVDVWDIRNTPAREPLRSYSRCASLSLSPDDLYLAIGSSGDDAKISVRSLSGVVEASCFFHRLAPLASHPEPFTYISPSAHGAWKSGDLERVENILSREIKEKPHQGFECYAHANRALVRVRLDKLDGALDDVGKIVTGGAQIPPVAHIARAMALIGQGKRTEGINAFGCVHHNDTKKFVECIRTVILFEAELRDQQNRGARFTGPPPVADVHSCAWVETRKLFLLAKQCIQRQEHDDGLQYLAKVPDLSPFIHVSEAKTIQLVFGWNIYDLECMVQQLRWRALFASGRTREVDFPQTNKNCLDEESEARKADLGWLSEKFGDEAMRRRNFDDAITWYSLSLHLCPESRIDDCGSEFAKECLSAIEVAHHATDGTTTDNSASIAP